MRRRNTAEGLGRKKHKPNYSYPSTTSCIPASILSFFSVFCVFCVLFHSSETENFAGSRALRLLLCTSVLSRVHMCALAWGRRPSRLPLSFLVNPPCGYVATVRGYGAATPCISVFLLSLPLQSASLDEFYISFPWLQTVRKTCLFVLFACLYLHLAQKYMTLGQAVKAVRNRQLDRAASPQTLDSVTAILNTTSILKSRRRKENRTK